MQKIVFQSDLYIGQGLLEGPLAFTLCSPYRNALIIADENVRELYAEPLGKKLHAEVLSFGSGEGAKTRETKAKLEDALVQQQVGRDTVLIGMGGGVATDLVGFLAATYMRGVPLILIPTTLMAMVDASIGGKNGVNTPAGKNLIGSIYHPKAIISDLNTLSTLPKKEWLNGRAEILKMGLICGAPDSIEGVARAKISVVERDPSERGLRRILNFGHTVAHALEAISNYELAHGEAVAIGCLAESFLSVLLGYLPESALDEIRKRFSDFPLRLPIQYLRESFLDAMTLDKKGAGGQVRIVLIDRIGHAMEFDGAYCRPVEKIDLQQMAEWMEMRYGFLPNQSLQRERISLHSPF